MAEEVVDTTVTTVDGSKPESGGNPPDSPPGAEVKNTDGSSASEHKEDTLPFDQHPKWQAARAAEQERDEILEKYGFEDMSALAEAIERGMSLEDTLSGRDLETLLDRDDLLTSYEQHWAEEERKKLLEGETPEDTIARLEREKQELQDKYASEADKIKQAQSAEQAIRDFNSGMETFIGQQDIPEEYRPVARLLLGIDNPIMDIDISDKRAVDKTATNLMDALRSLEEAAVARYKAGHKTPPPQTPLDGGGETPAPGGEKKIKNLKDAKAAFLERLTAARKQ